MTRRLTRRLLFALTAAAASAVVYASIGTAATSAAPQSTSPPTISGTAQQGQALVASSGGWDSSTTVSYQYQWNQCNTSGSGCAAISGATTQTYTLGSTDVGHTITVTVTATNASGSAQATSAPTDVVAGTAADALANTKAPELTGTLQQGQTLTLNPGTWSGTAPITYSYEWQRCNGEGINCSDFATNTTSTYTLGSADVGNRLQVRVTAKNAAGSAVKYSNQTAVIGVSGTAPADTAAPALSGTFAVGQTLHVSPGTWTGTQPITLSYQWQRCNGQGVNCAPIAGATGQTYALAAADAGNRVQVLVTAKNSVGTTSKYSNQSPNVGGSSGTTQAAGTVDAKAVVLPNRLVIDKVQFPAGGHARTPFQARFHVADTAGHSVSGALVYVLGLPYGWVRNAPEQATDASGWATITLDPTFKMPRRTALVMFVRARTPQGDLLAGASTRRLVQVLIRG